MEKDNKRVTYRNPNNTLVLLVKVCLHILGLWSNDVSPTMSTTSTTVSSPVNDDYAGSNQDIEMRTFDQEKQHLLDVRERSEKVTNTICCWKSIWNWCFRVMDKYLWIFISMSVLMLMIYDLFTYLRCFWGRSEDVLFLVCYFTYIPQLAAVPFICLLASLNKRFDRSLSLSPACMFTTKYLLENIRFAKCRTVGTELCQFVMMLTWPVVNLCLGFYNYVTLEYRYSPVPWQMLVSRITAAIGLIQYSCLTYLCYKLRKAFAKGSQTYPTKLQYGNPMLTYAIMIWSQKAMFLLQPLLAFHSVNADYLWGAFKESIAERLTASERVGQMFHRFMRHMKELNHPPQWIISTLVFSTIGLYFGMHLKKQNFLYWIGPDCHMYFNETNDPGMI
ncbi:uncharacterized protein [Amphiura filiformis]|uniref:uncharacterized protein n=1 Tax=Amphiura filiformis TaxID=82378 RepID=UPI003B21C83A